MENFKYKYDELFNPLLKAIHQLGGSASVTELEDEVARILKLSEGETDDIHRGSTTKFTYRLAWARNYLKNYGIIDNSARGVWALTAKGTKVKSIDKNEVANFVKNLNKKKKKEGLTVEKEGFPDDIEGMAWQEGVLEILKNIPPERFERLCQRMLRELGFTSVEVTGRSGDGGIDGTGVVKIGGVLSFYVVFQCKRYKGTVPPSYIRDFRGAMVGRADKGLFITTGSFSKEAQREAKRDGAPPIDLLEGVEFVEKLKELNLGIETCMVEKVKIDKAWFESF